MGPVNTQAYFTFVATLSFTYLCLWYSSPTPRFKADADYVLKEVFDELVGVLLCTMIFLFTYYHLYVKYGDVSFFYEFRQSLHHSLWKIDAAYQFTVT